MQHRDTFLRHTEGPVNAHSGQHREGRQSRNGATDAVHREHHLGSQASQPHLSARVLVAHELILRAGSVRIRAEECESRSRFEGVLCQGVAQQRGHPLLPQRVLFPGGHSSRTDQLVRT